MELTLFLILTTKVSSSTIRLFKSGVGEKAFVIVTLFISEIFHLCCLIAKQNETIRRLPTF